MSAAKLERLLNLTAALVETAYPLSAAEIRARVPGYPEEDVAFRRAFERDKDDLREMGIPLRIERVRTGPTRDVDGYRIPREEHYLRDPGLESDELAALHLAARVVGMEAADEALRRLGGAAGDASAGSSGLDPRLPPAEMPLDPRLTSLFGALVDRHPVEFAYGGQARRVEPHRLDFQRGRWYLSGLDRSREGLRSFRLDRIEGSVSVRTGERFPAPVERHPGVRRQPWEIGGEAATVARLLVDADQAGWALQHLGIDVPEERHEDGSIVVAIPVANEAAFRSFVLAFLDHAEVLGPPELRASLVAWLESVAEGVEVGGA